LGPRHPHMTTNFCSGECAARVSVAIQSAWRRIAERFRSASHST
jgi:hypothetical protein